MDKDLFFKVFFDLTINKQEIRYYKKIRAFFNKDSFYELKQVLNYNPVFLVEILEVEKKHEEIKAIIEENHKNIWDLEYFLHPVLKIYPEFCFGIIKSVTEIIIEKNRSRNYYQRIASFLQLGKNIPGYDNQLIELTMQLYNHKPSLPALKDEFRKAGIV